jgi:CRISPR/Cas system-associated exonuclease Cas4 (RecB family)
MRRTIRASEIGSFLYCQRAWWYRRQGMISENTEGLTLGSQIHERHGRAVMLVGCMRYLAYALFLAALVLVVVALTNKII